MSYPFREETKTLHFRWLVGYRDDTEKVLQQKVVIREGFGLDAKSTEEWRTVETIVEQK